MSGQTQVANQSKSLTKMSPAEIVEEFKRTPFAQKSRVMGFVLDKFEPVIRRHLFGGMTYQRLRSSVVRLAADSKNTKLFECDPQSLIEAIKQAAAYGWEVGGVLGHCYLVPYSGSVQMQPGYKGMMDLAYRSGVVTGVCVECVYEGDVFEVEFGDSDKITHKPSMRQDRHQQRITHVYAIVRMNNGDVARAVMTREQIEAHKQQYSKMWNKADSAWSTAWEAMAKKTLLLQVMRRGKVPLSVEDRKLLASDPEVGDGYDGTTIDAVATVVVSDDHPTIPAVGHDAGTESDGQMGDRQ